MIRGVCAESDELHNGHEATWDHWQPPPVPFALLMACLHVHASCYPHAHRSTVRRAGHCISAAARNPLLVSKRRVLRLSYGFTAQWFAVDQGCPRTTAACLSLTTRCLVPPGLARLTTDAGIMHRQHGCRLVSTLVNLRSTLPD